MDMDILVHVTAPGTVRHDKRQLALAQAIIDFHPASVTHVMRCEEKGRRDNSLSSQQQVTIAGEGNKARLETKNPRKRARAGSTSFSNPPYRNPYHGTRLKSRLQTPVALERPRTAPELSASTIQVPRTHRERRRAVSDSFQSLTSRVANSQEPEILALETSSDGRVSSPLGFEDGLVLSLSQTSLEDQPRAKRPCLEGDNFGSSLLLPSSPGAGALFLRGRSLVWTTSPTPAVNSAPDTQSGTSTATPSQPFQDLERERPYSSQPSPEKATSIVSISSGDTQRSMTNGQMASHPRSIEAADDSGFSRPFPAIDDLPLEVTAPQPAVGNSTFKTHVTKHLQELMETLPLHKLFKPLRVTRDVKVLERGHWLLQIVIAADEVVKQARTSPSKETAINAYTERFAGSTAEERLAKFWQVKDAGKMSEYDYGHDDEAVGKWTEAEFPTFWSNMSEFLRKGHAGWGVRMVRDDLDISPPAPGLRKLRVRIFTWGEVIGHMFLAIWLFSQKVSVRIPMKWVAGDGSVVVEMSGKKKFTGHLPPWVRKGPAGEGGSWGLSDS